MATTMDTQMHELNHDTLMGLQELDSHLSIYENSSLGRDSYTPDANGSGSAISMSTVTDSVNAAEQPLHSIVVDSPEINFTQKYPSDVGSRASRLDKKSLFNTFTQYVSPHVSRLI
jgi:lysine-specific histone demethylase 1